MTVLRDSTNAGFNELFHDLLPVSKLPKDYGYWLDIARANDPELMPLAHHLMTTGGFRSRGNAAYWFKTAIECLHEHDDEWRQDFADTFARNEVQWGRPLQHAITSGWWAGYIEDSTNDEVKLPFDFTKQMRNIWKNWRFLHPEHNGNNTKKDYWLGIAVLAAVPVVINEYNWAQYENPLARLTPEEAETFTAFAGSYEDTAGLVLMMRERGIMDVRTLQELLVLKDEAGVPLSNGAL